MAKIKQIIAREILSSGSTPSVEVKCILESGTVGIASVPYGASAGIREAFVLLDGDKSRFMGKGMLKAVENVNKIIAPVLVGMEGENQKEIDQKIIELDGTERKTNLGANAILGVSLAVARASANDQKLPMYNYIRKAFNLEKYGLLQGKNYVLPNPMMVVIEGGAHADQSTDLQEYMISMIGNDSVKENVRKGIEIYFTLKKVLKDKGYNSNVGNEGAFAPNGLPTNETPLELIKEAVEKSGYEFGKDVGISLDPAVSEIFENGKYELAKDGKNLNSEEMIEYFENWIEKYPIITLEDALAETDWGNWPKLLEKIGDKVSVVGDDLTVTNPKLLQKVIEEKAINAILIKLNQIGTLSETVECCMLARKNGIMTIISHRGGGETNDTTMIDLAVAVNAGFVKVGPSRGERVEKYNRLMEIEDELLGNCTVAGSNFRKII
ncbi:MAG: phosphopyruvate hydratase [Candidatus Staskawiczbacteria bacterium RIFOXYB2_FULL_32_9]|uniref:Enolase n=1 Tax=Candidatus Staskawiczbacteria bacterium RIFOXYD1_FULL_32_13 TaxID=1802234 RepID=A0A1G2JRC1_9BACT|nr:MAG: Enolase [Parcubacteria group bacterium GW2011_GWC2_32_10]OGZ78884.1 MAG: phosphopyruvate hydratase [Candidatus Staskawiczbacteria bacterium RIFOXYA2_FULL_32_7]OGZ79805.1 MAG: phosphopyruvate hydratase [Candidatus Staskawiczbacteria bacterium RIFOXYB1_FULL_32_11]OGZ81060.1 MAG: phosphopyruvate hydratase [Candidatus Staskawiczbacteria bacterium RIFOXYB2_FULL_32_9]OGZ86103.1 MAG: phosphopyruvate hydratase [Candidatus Staskawiczbacteria bacterium RIFOXYC2_FULL_32_10]OGZ89675.1 MAG: phospho